MRFIVVVLISALVGCAHYGTSASGSGAYGSVSVPQLDNQSLEPGLQQALTDSLIDRFVSTTGMRVVDEDRAAIVLQGTITEVTEQPFTYEGGTDQLRITIRVDMSCYDTEQKKTIWEEKGLRGFGIYDAEVSRQEARTTGLGEAIQMFVEDVVDRTQVGGW